ncbi:hypothetical protein [Streptomyces nigra]|uniref:hypothetical protein n=1 Tax=Streptomyces nigra TaxID=1827580 RepID=UPI00382BC8F4
MPSTQAPFGQDTVRQEMDAAVVAAGLPEGETEAGFPKPRHWETTPTEDVPTENGGIYVIATYKKQGWILNARHSSMHPWVESTAMATKESCFDSLTDEETGILEDVD